MGRWGILILVNLLSSFFLFAQEIDFNRASWLFLHENYEEALPLLERLRKEQPNSAEIAFYLGMTYKRMQDYPNAYPHLKAAVELNPKLEAAYIELIDLLYQNERFSEAEAIIAQAEKEGSSSATLEFFRGLLILREEKDKELALEAFKRAENLEPALSQTIKYYKALVYMESKRFKEARTLFKEIVLKDPSTDLAIFASEYMDLLLYREKALKPFKASLSCALQYDDNVVAQPNDKAFSVDNKADLKYVFSGQAEYDFKVSERWGIKSGASIYTTKHNDLGFYDTLSLNFPLQPNLYLEKMSIGFPLNYNYVSIHDNKYMDTISLGNTYTLSLKSANILQWQFQYNLKRYFWAADNPEDNRDSRQYLFSFIGFHFFDRNYKSLLNLGYTFGYNDAHGANWRYRENRLSLGVVLALTKRLKWNFVADYSWQDYLQRHASYDKERQDSIITVLNLFSYEIYSGLELELQHTFINDLASIGVYKYHKNVYGLGLKYRF